LFQPPNEPATPAAALRAIVTGAADRAWTQAERALYGLLLEEWEAALRGEVVEAA
jgi:hypothetical protein